MDTSERVVLITGAKGGLGTFVTSAFLTAGSRVIGVSRSISASDFPHERFTAMPAELTGGDAARKIIADALAQFGRIDALVHLMGAFAGGSSVADTDDATLDRMLDLNFKSTFHMVRAVLPQMRKQAEGRIAAIGSKAAVEPQALAGVYAASKAAVVSLIRTIARENADLGISANVVLPGTMDTPANRAAMPAADFSQWVDPDQVAHLLVHLVLGESSQVSGAVIPVYGRDA